jgi:hypothetical protein
MLHSRSGSGRRPDPQPRGRAAALCQDTRGAIMVIGLLASILLLGVLWMIIRLGDGIAARDQAGAAADAIAFSTAVVHARSLNLIALINILTAAILAVRVVLRVLEIAIVMLSIPTFGASLAALPPVLAVDEASIPGINTAVMSLGTSAQMVLTSVPAMARASATYIGRRYRPLVKDAIVTNAGAESLEGVMGLPLEVNTTGAEECGHAASFMPDMLKKPLGMIGFGWLARAASKPARKIVGTGATALFFCGMGANLPSDGPGNSLPGTEELAKQAEENCKKQVADSGLDPLSKAAQDQYQMCKAASADLVNTAGQAAGQIAVQMANDALGLILPTTMGIKDWQNGDPYWQILAVPTLDLSSMAPNAMVSLAAFGKASVGGIPKGTDRAMAEAEFYYDCTDYWEDGDCGGPEEPMWNLRWKARLVRTDVNSPVVKAIVDPLKATLQQELSRSSKMAREFYGDLDSLVVH